MKSKSATLQKLAETADRLANSATHGWKEQGSRVMGYFCSAVPEELFTAAVGNGDRRCVGFPIDRNPGLKVRQRELPRLKRDIGGEIEVLPG